MLKTALLCISCLIISAGYTQTYVPIPVTGFNHDVIAEGTGGSSLAVTSKEMDAITPSNYVICTQQFATANSIPAGYGLPDNGLITSGSKSYQLAPLGSGTGLSNNALYLLKTEIGTLTLQTPGTYKNLSLLVTATEGAADITATVNYTDGTNQAFTLNILDWVGTSAAILSGFGRIKRIAGPFGVGTYEMGGVNPKLYSLEMNVSCSKVVSSVDFQNVTSGSNTGSNRAFIFAISGDSASLPVTPVLKAVPDTICVGQSSVLSVQSPVTGLTYLWYTFSAGGLPVNNTSTYTTPNLSGTTTYYVESSNGACTSPRTPIQVTVLPAPTKATADTARICEGGSATLNVTNAVSGYSYTWYAVATGGTSLATGTSYVTPALTTNTTYYIEVANGRGCINGSRTAVPVIVTPNPAAPTATAAPICPNQTATINITGPSGNVTYSYYDLSTGGTLLGTGVSYITPQLTLSTTYYLEASNAQGCISGTRSPVTVTVLPQPAAPAATASPVCPGQTSTISITSPDATTTYSYYTAATGGTAVATGTSFTTPAVTGSVTYYIEAASAAGCVSSTRTAITIPFSPSPAAPAATAASVCPGNPTTIVITNADPAVTYTYYAFPSGGTILGTGTSYTTPPVSNATTYYIQSTSAGGCTSTRIPLSLTLYPVPLPPPAITYAEICNGQPAILTILNPDPTLSYGFYTAATGGTPVGNGTTYTTPPITGAVTYYVQSTNGNGCPSARSFMIVNYTPPPSAPVVTATQACSGHSATIVVSNPDTTLHYNYYTTATGGAPIGSGTSFNTPAASSSVTYYVEAVNSPGCGSSPRTPVTISVVSALAVPSVTATSISASSVTFTWAPVPGASAYQVSVNGGAYITPSSGATGTTHSVNGVTAGQTVEISVRALGAVACETSLPGLASALIPSTEIFIPNTFTPNDDGVNDVFMVYGKSITALDLKVFNQWGQLVFNSGGNNKGWDGRYKERDLAVGVYVYIANITMGTTKITKKGTINLVR